MSFKSLSTGCRLMVLTLAIAGCETETPASIQPHITDRFLGKEFVPYPLNDGREILIKGVQCKLFNWDRPISDTQVVRIRSASCPVPGATWMRSVEVDRSVIPLSESARSTNHQHP